MHLVQNGRGDWVAVFDVEACSGCGASFARLGTYRPVPKFCHVHYETHWELVCRACEHRNPDHDCTADEPHNPLDGHRVGPRRDQVQHGPTLDLGDG